MTDQEKEAKVMALGHMALLKPTIEDLKDKRRKLARKLSDGVSDIVAEHSGHTSDFDAGKLASLSRQLGDVQKSLMDAIREYNTHAERASADRILTRTIAIIA